MQAQVKNRSPTLQTVLMVDEFIKKHSGDFKKTNLFNSLPKKMMWNTFQVIMSYLEEMNRIGYDSEGHVLYIWDPKFFEKYKNISELEI